MSSINWSAIDWVSLIALSLFVRIIARMVNSSRSATGALER